MNIVKEISRYEKRLIYVSNIETYRIEKAIQKARIIIIIAKIIYGFELMRSSNIRIVSDWHNHVFTVPATKTPFEDGKRLSKIERELERLSNESTGKYMVDYFNELRKRDNCEG